MKKFLRFFFPTPSQRVIIKIQAIMPELRKLRNEIISSMDEVSLSNAVEVWRSRVGEVHTLLVLSSQTGEQGLIQLSLKWLISAIAGSGSDKNRQKIVEAIDALETALAVAK